MVIYYAELKRKMLKAPGVGREGTVRIVEIEAMMLQLTDLPRYIYLYSAAI